MPTLSQICVSAAHCKTAAAKLEGVNDLERPAADQVAADQVSASVDRIAAARLAAFRITDTVAARVVSALLEIFVSGGTAKSSAVQI